MNTRISIIVLLGLYLLYGCKTKKIVTDTVNHTGNLESTILPNVWQAIGPFGSPVPLALKGEWSAHGSGRFECIDINPSNSSEILLGHATSGLFKTTDGGATWNQKLDVGFATGIFDIVRFRKNHKHLIACCATDIGADKIYGYGLVESFDGGETWQRNSLQYNPFEYSIRQQRAIAIADKKDEQRLVSISDHDVYLSKDGARTWNIVYSTKQNLKSIKVNPEDDQSIAITGNVFITSTDGGESWQDKTSALCTSYGGVPSNFARYEVCFSEKQRNKLWISVSHNSSYLMSTDGYFTNFKLISKSQFTGNIYHMTMGLFYDRKENKEQLFVGTTRLYRSMDEGVTFRQITTPENGAAANVHDDVNDIFIQTDGQLYIATDGGADVSKDAALSWHSLTHTANNLNASLIFGFDRSESGVIMAGTQDKGIFIFKADTWFCSNMYGDGGRIAAINDSNGFVCGYAKKCYKTLDAGRSFNYNHAGADINFFDFRMDFSLRSKTLYIANQQLYRQTEGNNFELISRSVPAERAIGAFHVNHENEDEIWMSRMDATWGGPLMKKLYFTNDGGLNWQDKTDVLPILRWRSISDIDINRFGDIAISLNGLDGENGERNKVYISTDGGNTFVNSSEGLPNLSVNTLEPIGNQWVCGTANGVYIKERDGHWEPLGKDFPATMVSELKYFEKRKMLYVSTFGRGMWRIMLD